MRLVYKLGLHFLGQLPYQFADAPPQQVGMALAELALEADERALIADTPPKLQAAYEAVTRLEDHRARRDDQV